MDLKWAGYPGNNPYKLGKACLEKLKELYNIGKRNKKRKVSADRAHQILMDTILIHHRDKKLILSVAKIKAFFQLTPQKMEESIRTCTLETEEVLEAEQKLIAAERETTAQTLQDFDDDIPGGIDEDCIMEDSDEGIML